ncbi:peptide ABC transporter permease [Staphylococcus simulans]|uniref:peptide ABC transporter permease n=1 Tax=Staphylococcus simulans TaxID=1286 RepID=UPI00399ADC12
MRLELRTTVLNKITLILGSLFLLLFVLGYGYTTIMSNNHQLSYGSYFFNTYTIAVETGFILFSFIIAYYFNKEYADQNILFYKLLGNTGFTFFYKKMLVIFLECFVFVVIGITVTSLLFNNFSHYFFLITMFSLLILQYILIIGTISILISNILTSVITSLIYWVVSIVLVILNPTIFGILAPFEASNVMYPNVDTTLNGDTLALTTYDITLLVVYFPLLFAINFVVLFFARKRWLQLGL